MTTRLSVAVIGCGLVGRRRAIQAAQSSQTRLALVADVNAEAAASVAAAHGCTAATSWQEALAAWDLDIVVVATPNGFLHDIAVAALAAGKHVLIEKPMGRNLTEARSIETAAAGTDRLLKVGFNHRYHPAISHARKLLADGFIGKLINIRARYGHGGRPGYEKDWRGNLQLAGGGELTDQGVHIADLIHWFAGEPGEAFAFTQTAVWPIKPLEDNAFGLFRFPGGAVASFHTSWTQWKNLFSFEVFGEGGALTIDGLGGSYGAERLITSIRRPEGGAPDTAEQTFDAPDQSWELEWADFVGAIMTGSDYWGTPHDGVIAMKMLDALYASARENSSRLM